MREKLIELLKGTPDIWMSDEASENIANHIIANGVTVPVRCKDCKYWADGVAGCTDCIKCCKIGYYMVGENGYCVYGKRREEE